jgi:hypothetical protein
MEEWRDIPGYGNHYQASNLGNIRVKDRIVEKVCGFKGVKKPVKQFYKGRLLSLNKSDKYGHCSVHIGYDNKKVTVFVHKLVLLAFVGPCPEGMECCHNNGIASDNRIENLRWDTHFNNNADRKRHGNYKTGKDHHMYGKKISEEARKKLIEANKGKKQSLETIAKRSESIKKYWENNPEERIRKSEFFKLIRNKKYVQKQTTTRNS